MILDFYKENTGNTDISDIAIDKLVKRLLQDNLVGQNKIIDIEDTDIESQMNAMFMPTICYTFKYDSDSDVVAGIKMQDIFPLIYCMRCYGTYISGINFNLLPNEARAMFLEIIDKASDNFYTEKGANEAFNNKFVINEMLADAFKDKSAVDAFFKLLENKIGYSLYKAYRRYNVKHIKDIRVIEYVDMKYIPFLNFTDSVRGTKLIELQKRCIFAPNR